MPKDSDQRLAKETQFHDSWAEETDISKIDVVQMNTALTAPEMRYIRSQLGDLHGKRLLDVGCGLGEASVYFALEGAVVTATDLSPGMLKATEALSARYRVVIKPHLSAAEDLKLGSEKFDVIYVGNLFHHVDIEPTLRRLLPHLEKDGILVSWDPIEYNPVINAYRRRATEVRTPDEHPLRWRDLKRFEKFFARVERKYFWLSTLSVFLVMALVQRRDPNKERYWKRVVEESAKWAPLYRPLALFDRMILKALPPLRLLCWNVVVVARHPLN